MKAIKELKFLGVDISKNVFAIHGYDSKGKTVLKKTLKRNEFKLFISQCKHCEIGIETGSGCHYWARFMTKMGHTVKIIPAQFVVAYRKSGKNDSNDSEAIVEALTRPNMRFVAVKQPESIDIQMIHRVRQRYVYQKIALGNQIRGYLSEYGIIIPKRVSHLKKELRFIIDDTKNELTPLARATLRELYNDLNSTLEKIKNYDEEIEKIAEKNEQCQRIMKIEGIGPITATAIVASVQHMNEFKSGRHFSAWVGLTPRQNTTGGKQKLGSITKKGNIYLRTLLIHGARAVINTAKKFKKQDRKSKWIIQLENKKGYAKSAVAYANKNARVIWALLTKNTEYKVAV